jgi:hypothetical protein
MPEPNHRPPWQIAGKLGGWAIWQLVEQRVTLVIECDACPNVAKWAPADLNRHLGMVRGRSLAWVAPYLRCSRCKSEWIRISQEKGSMLGARPEIW